MSDKIDYTDIRDYEIRTKICELMSEMLDNPDQDGIYPTSKFMWEMETYILSFQKRITELELNLKAFYSRNRIQEKNELKISIINNLKEIYKKVLKEQVPGEVPPVPGAADPAMGGGMDMGMGAQSGGTPKEKKILDFERNQFTASLFPNKNSIS